MKNVNCGHCGRKLAIAEYIEIQIKCPRCKTLNHLRAESPPPAPMSATVKEMPHGQTNHGLDGWQATACR